MLKAIRIPAVVACGLIAVAMVVVGWVVARSIDPDMLSGPTVLFIATLGVGITLVPIGELVDDVTVTVDGVLSIVLFAVLAVSAEFAVEPGSDLAGIDTEILLGLALASMVFAVHGVRNLAVIMATRRQPPPGEHQVLTQQVDELAAQLANLHDTLNQLSTSLDRTHPCSSYSISGQLSPGRRIWQSVRRLTKRQLTS